MDGGMLEEAVGAKLIYNAVSSTFGMGASEITYIRRICQEIATEISGRHVLDAAGTLIP